MRDLIKDSPLIDRERDIAKDSEEKKALHSMGLEPMTSLYKGLCSTAVLQQIGQIGLQHVQQQ